MLYWHKHGDGWKTPVPMEEDPLLDTDMLMSEFSDTLFSTLSSHQPVAWPNPREIGNPGPAQAAGCFSAWCAPGRALLPGCHRSLCVGRGDGSASL